MGQYLLGRSGLILASEMSCRNINSSRVVILQKLIRDEGCRCLSKYRETSHRCVGRSPEVTKGGHFKPEFAH